MDTVRRLNTISIPDDKLVSGLFLLLVAVLLVGYSPSANSVSTASRSCLVTSSSCSPSIFKPTPYKPTKPSPVAAPSATRTNCQPNSIALKAYETQALNTLASTNAAADNARQAAQTSGQAYGDFDSTLNGIFAAYNSQIGQEYSNYLNTLHGCPASVSPPQLFQMFIP